MVINDTKINHSKALQNLTKFGIFGLKTNHLASLPESRFDESRANLFKFTARLPQLAPTLRVA
jgi:hypothetical protein